MSKDIEIRLPRLQLGWILQRLLIVERRDTDRLAARVKQLQQQLESLS